MDQGGKVITEGNLGMNQPEETRRRLLDHANIDIADSVEVLVNASRSADPQIQVDASLDLAVNIQQVESGAAVHIIRYDYREEEDRVPTLHNLEMAIRLPEHFDHIQCFDPAGMMTGTVSREGDQHTLSLSDVPLYSVVLLRNDAPAPT
jgi:hypothetical protein